MCVCVSMYVHIVAHDSHMTCEYNLVHRTCVCVCVSERERERERERQREIERGSERERVCLQFQTKQDVVRSIECCVCMCVCVCVCVSSSRQSKT